MGSHGAEIDDQPTASETPGDVAAVYAWANLQGAKYRDYSGSRREYRAQIRYRAARAILERELRAQAESEIVAAEAARVAQAAGTAASQEIGNKSSRIESWRSAEAAARRASADRVEAARRAEAAAHTAMVEVREEREIAEASLSGRSQPDFEAEQTRNRHIAATDGEAMGANPPSSNPRVGDSGADTIPYLQFPMWREELVLDPGVVGRSHTTGSPAQDAAPQTEHSGPAWLYAAQTTPQTRDAVSRAAADRRKAQAARAPTPDNGLQNSREHVAPRWLAMKTAFENATPESPAEQPVRTEVVRSPLLAVFSLAGGVGKTSLAATLGRALSAKGERVLLVDTTACGLIPFYFGGSSLAPGMRCGFAPTPDRAGAPISLVVHDAAGDGSNDEQRATLAKEILAAGPGHHRMVLDLAAGSSWLIQRLADLNPTVLVPVVPELNSVFSLQSVERMFQGTLDSEGRPVLPFYVLNQFHSTLPLHLDVRDLLKRQLRDRLLPFTIRVSEAVSEALAQGMTVLDYTPDAPISQDYLDVAAWLSRISPPATKANSNARWGEL